MEYSGKLRKIEEDFHTLKFAAENFAPLEHSNRVSGLEKDPSLMQIHYINGLKVENKSYIFNFRHVFPSKKMMWFLPVYQSFKFEVYPGNGKMVKEYFEF